MEIEHIHLKNRGAFVIKGEARRVAEMTYKIDGGVMDIDHTEVDESLRGQGIGEELLAKAVEYARGSDLKISSTCPYASKLLGRNSDYADILA